MYYTHVELTQAPKKVGFHFNFAGVQNLFWLLQGDLSLAGSNSLIIFHNTFEDMTDAYLSFKLRNEIVWRKWNLF